MEGTCFAGYMNDRPTPTMIVVVHCPAWAAPVARLNSFYTRQESESKQRSPVQEAGRQLWDFTWTAMRANASSSWTRL